MDGRQEKVRKKRLVIFCAGNLGKEVYDMAERVNEQQECWSDICFADNFFTDPQFYGVPVHRLDGFLSEKEKVEFVVANGEPTVREELHIQLEKAGCHLINLIDPTAIISKTAQLGQGIIIMPYTTVSSNVVLEDNVLLQSYIRVGHDIHVGANSVISANTAIGGGCVLGKNVFVGMGAVVLEERRLGTGAVLGMGAVLYQDLEERRTAVGNPARVTKGSESGKVFEKKTEKE